MSSQILVRDSVRSIIDVNIHKYQDCEGGELKVELVDWMTDKILKRISDLGCVIKVDSGWCPAHGYPLPCDKCGAPKGTWGIEPLIDD